MQYFAYFMYYKSTNSWQYFFSLSQKWQKHGVFKKEPHDMLRDFLPKRVDSLLVSL